MKKIRVLLWDIDNTLLDFTAAEKEAIRKTFQDFQFGTCDDEMIWEYSKINDKYWEMLEKGLISRKQTQVGRFMEFFNNHDLDTDKAEEFNITFQRHLPETICFMDDGYEIVKSLKGKLLQCCASNGTASVQERKLKDSGLKELFELVFISEEIGKEKPMKEFFDEAIRQVDLYLKQQDSTYSPLDREEVMIIGDSLTSDMRGGNNAGIRCCWYNPRRKINDKDVRIDCEIHDLHEILTILEYQSNQ